MQGQDKSGFGVLFEITTAGTYVPQHDFSGGADGGEPGRIFFDASGNIYGGTAIGGSCTGTGLPAAGCGTVYQFVPSTGQFNVLYTFTGTTDGYEPALGGFDSRGILYGATEFGGANGYGTLFKLVPNPKTGGYAYVHLYDFTGGSDGGDPVNPFVQPNGTLVGGTTIGPVVSSDDQGAGVLYKFTPGTSQFQTLYTFTNNAHGGYPFGTPTVNPATGIIYGTTTYGGVVPCSTTGGTLISSFGCGTVFEFKP